MEEYVPIIIPITRANANSLINSPTKGYGDGVPKRKRLPNGANEIAMRIVFSSVDVDVSEDLHYLRILQLQAKEREPHSASEKLRHPPSSKSSQKIDLLF
jgi:hypothetical protein